MDANLGGTVKGISVRQTVNSVRTSEDAVTRRLLRDSWNNTNIQPSINGQPSQVGPFRAAFNLGDYLGRQN